MRSPLESSIVLPSLVRNIAGALLLLVLAACASQPGGPIPYDVQGFGRPDAPTIATVNEDYQIAPLDTLTVEVFKSQELSKDYQVDLTGNIFMPLIGEVKAAGITARQLQAELVRRLGKDYFESPQVSVALKASAARQVTVDGAVTSPGLYPIVGPVTLIQTIAMAKGPTETANPHRIAVFRQVQGQKMAAAFDLTRIRRGEAEDPQIYPGDIIVVDGSGIKAAQKELLSAVPLLSIFRPF